MLRSEIQNKTGLTRKAIEYYEERKIIKPKRSENGYRDYSEGFGSVTNIFIQKTWNECSRDRKRLYFRSKFFPSIQKERTSIRYWTKRKAILELIIEVKARIIDKIALIEMEERFMKSKAFPDILDKWFFVSAVLNEP